MKSTEILTRYRAEIKLNYSSNIVSTDVKPTPVEGCSCVHFGLGTFCLDEEIYDYVESRAISGLVKNALEKEKTKGKQLVRIVNVTQDLVVDPAKENIGFFLKGLAIYR